MTRTARNVFAIPLCLCLFTAALESGAAPFDPDKVPGELADWVPWVLHEVPDRVCPLVDGAAVCLWPGRLALVLDETGGRFTQQVYADREIPLSLPGDRIHWPESVRIDGREAIVFERDGRPSVTVSPGSHQLTGLFAWGELPEGIQIPPATALVSVTVREELIPFPRRDQAGLLWLTGELRSRESDTLTLSVMRKVVDAIPVTVETRIVLRASGKAREVRLENVLLEKTVPLSVIADIPARLDADGNLDMQVRAGTHTLTIVARTLGSPSSLAPLPRKPPWPDREVWVWQADETLRQVTLSGAPGIDPSRTDLPAEWQSLPAYFMQPGDKLTLVTKRRGEPEPPPDQIEVDRAIWMDLDGAGFTIRDNVSGTLNRSWRLDLEPPGKLGHVAVNGVDQLITTGPGNGHGVELRKGALAMRADWRIEHGPSAPLAAAGWTENISTLGATLNLPPGWTLLTASGVDEVRGTWWDKWNLFSFFFVLIVSMAIGRLTRWPYGIVALLVLVLSHHEPDAPFAVWVSLLISLALLKVLHRGKLLLADKLIWWGSVLWLAAVLVPFSVTEVRTGLFPQVREGGDTSTAVSHDLTVPETMEDKKLEVLQDAPTAEKRTREVSRSLMSVTQALEGDSAYNNEPAWLRKAQQQDPKATVQTGPGLPSWQWSSRRLQWSGPVSKGHTLKLYLLSPKVNLFLSVLRVLLLALVAVRLVLEGLRAGRRPEDAPREKSAPPPAGVAVLLLAGAVAIPAGAHADEGEVPPGAMDKTTTLPGPLPDRAILDELRARLTAPADCRPECVSTSVLSLDITDDILTLDAEVHAEAPSSWSIPGPAQNWIPANATINGIETRAIVMGEDGFLRVRLDRGVNRVRVRGPLPPTGVLTLELQHLPKRAVASLSGWIAAGIREDGQAESSIQLNRQVQNTADAKAFEEGAYPPWLEVTRTLDLGVQWLVHTTVRRVSPIGSPVMVTVPLLAGESVTQSGLTVENGAAVISMGRNDADISWSSTLDERKTIAMKAPSKIPWSEVWVVRCSAVWSCGLEGPAPIRRQSEGVYAPTFRPWPGEKLTVTTAKPAGVDGQSVTIDSAEVSYSPGKRLVKATLSLTIRTSRGGEQIVTLPGGADVQTLSVDGKNQPFRKKGNRLAVTLRPGKQVIQMQWQQEGGIRSLYRTPEIALAGQSANVTTKVVLPRDRWLLAVGGPSWGPAVLFWGFLLTILLAGLILGRVRLSPLKSRQWMLLALGLTQIPVAAALVIVTWFLVMAWRAEHPLPHVFWHNSRQILLGAWTLAALGCLVAAVYSGLAVQPDMQVAGNGSTDTHLNWYTDHVTGVLPSPWILSVPLLVWKVIMLLWALWLASAIVKWAPWTWRAFTADTIWRRVPPHEFPAKTPNPSPTPPSPAEKDILGE